MSHAILGVIGVILFIGLALASASYYNASFLGSQRLEAAALRLVSERNQIEMAVDQYIREEGRLPVETGAGAPEPMEILRSGRYLKDMPPGDGAGWRLIVGYGSIMTRVDPGRSLSERMLMCHIARRRMEMPNPEMVYRCDGSDHPDGRLDPRDPCCLGVM